MKRRARSMADNLRPLRIRLGDPADADALIAFLRRRSCVADQVGPAAIDVWPPPLLHEDAARPDSSDARSLALAEGDVACSACGSAIEEALSRLGSPRCHDCRTGEQNGNPFASHVNGNGRFQLQRARVELQAYLRAWRAENGGADASLSD